MPARDVFRSVMHVDMIDSIVVLAQFCTIFLTEMVFRAIMMFVALIPLFAMSFLGKGRGGRGQRESGKT
jgi:hypothetical protein